MLKLLLSQLAKINLASGALKIISKLICRIKLALILGRTLFKMVTRSKFKI